MRGGVNVTEWRGREDVTEWSGGEGVRGGVRGG